MFQVQRLAVNKRGRSPCPHDLYRIKQSHSFRFIKRWNVYKTTVSSFKIVAVQWLSHVQLFVTRGLQHARLPCPSPTISRSLCKLMSIELVITCYHLIFCHPLLLLLSIFPSIRVFSNELALHIRWPKYWSFSFSLSNDYSGLISFRIDWFDLLAVQGTLKSLLQHHSSKASILQCSAFFMVGKVMSAF